MSNEILKHPYLFTLEKRGLVLTMTGGQIIQKYLEDKGFSPRVSSLEQARRFQIREANVLKKRYRTAKDGQNYMESVDYQWRAILFQKAFELLNVIQENWGKINPEIPFAVIVYGSLTRGLVKSPNHPDPSSVDLVVIGDTTVANKELLFNAIRYKRDEIDAFITANCPNKSPESKGGTAAVHIITPETLTNERFSPALNYIQSAARALYDPHGIWKNIEHCTLLEAINPNNRGRKK